MRRAIECDRKFAALLRTAEILESFSVWTSGTAQFEYTGSTSSSEVVAAADVIAATLTCNV